MAATGRVLAPLVVAASTAGWRVRSLVLDGAEILAVATALADPRVGAVLAGASDPPGADERPLMADLGALVAATTERRPDLVTVLAGGLAEPGGRIEGLFRPDRPGPTVLAPSPAAGGGEPLRALLDSLRGGANDGRRALAAATGTLADLLQRRIEVVEIGQSGATRTAAAWTAGAAAVPRIAIVPEAALLPRSFTDAHLDAVMGWLTVPLDRLRVRDRLRELALAPWGDARGRWGTAADRGGPGRPRAAGGRDRRLRRAPGSRISSSRQAAPGTSRRDRPSRWRWPTWCVARGCAPPAWITRGCWRRSGRSRTPEERRSVMADLRDDLVVPLGSVVIPAGLRPGRPAGRLVVRRRGRTGGAGPGAGRPGARGPGRPGSAPWWSWSSATPSGSGCGRATWRWRSPAGSGGCSWTCATCRCRCRTASSAVASCWPRGRPRCGRSWSMTECTACGRRRSRLAGRGRGPPPAGWTISRPASRSRPATGRSWSPGPPSSRATRCWSTSATGGSTRWMVHVGAGSAAAAGEPLGPGAGSTAPGPRDRGRAAGAGPRQGRPLAPGHRQTTA